MMDKDLKQLTKAVKEKGIPTPSTILDDRSLVEMVYDPDESRTRFAVFKDEKVHDEDTLLVQSQRLVPYSPHNSLLTNEVVLFPSRAEE